MKLDERLSVLGFLAFAVGAFAFLSTPIASIYPALAQQTTTNATSPQVAPEGKSAMTEE
jgi:hypothetical protein